MGCYSCSPRGRGSGPRAVEPELGARILGALQHLVLPLGVDTGRTGSGRYSPTKGDAFLNGIHHVKREHDATKLQ
jgi:hypothetical protein